LQILGTITQLSAESCTLLILYKPQFELGRDARRDSRGVVLDRDAIESCQRRFESEAVSLGWQLIDQAPSEVVGKEGNQEYLYHFQKKSGAHT